MRIYIENKTDWRHRSRDAQDNGDWLQSNESNIEPLPENIVIRADQTTVVGNHGEL